MKRKTFLRLALAALVTAASPACREPDPALDKTLSTLPPVAAGGSLVYAERSTATAYVLDLASDETRVRTVPIGLDPVIATARAFTGTAARSEVLVLSRGSRGEPGVAPTPGSLTAIPVGTSPVAPRVYDIGSPFNALSQTPDGRFAVAYYRPGDTQGRLLYNPNEVAIVDLDAAPSARNPLKRTVRSFGGVPNDVVFSPEMMVNGRARTLAVVLSDAYVTLIDLTHAGRSEITVRLTLPEDARAIRPSQVLFDTEAPALYVRADASDDIYVLRLNPVTAAAPTDNDFRPTINQLAAGRGPSDMALIGAADARRLLVVSPGSRDARFINAVANTTVTIPLEAAANRILLFTGTSPRDANAALRALLYPTRAISTAVSFLELADLENRRAQNVETLQLNRAIRAALALPERNALMFSHDSVGGGASLSLLDLTRRTASPIFAEVSLEGATFDDDRRTLWVAPPSSLRLGFINLQNFSPGEIRLDAPVTDVIPLTGDTAGRNRVVAIHQGAEGYLSVIDANAPRRETTVSLRGFFFNGLLDRSAP